MGSAGRDAPLGSARAGWPGSRLVRSLRIALLGCLVTGLMAAALEAVLLFAAPSFIPVTLAYPFIALMYFGAGVRAWWRRPGSMMGPLIVVGGVALLVAGLINTDVVPLVMVGYLSATLIVAVIIHLLLAFPSGLVRGTLPRVVVTIAYLSTTLAQAAFVFFDGVVADLGHLAQRVGGALMIIGTVIVITGRLRAASREQRRTLLPLTVYGMAVVVFIPSGPTLMRLLFDATPLEIGVAQLIGIAGIPIAFLAAVMRGAFAPTAEAEALAAWLSAGPDRPRTREVLARALGDPTVTLAYRTTDGSGFVDADGSPAIVPEPGSRPRDTVFVEVAGEPVGALTYDATSVDGRVAREAARVVALAIEGERLTAALRASEAQLRRSRARVVEAADRERSRISRDLHDGIQARLVLLGVDAQRLARASTSGLDPVFLRERATQLREGIDGAAAEVRRLAHGVMPATLEQRGLAAAVEDLTDRLAVPTSVTLRAPERLAPDVARTAYFLVAEALTNVTKHGRAGSIIVAISTEGDTLVVEVGDDGVGGAQPRAGTGLSGLRDRVETLGGRLLIDSPPGAGTRIRGELPCES